MEARSLTQLLADCREELDDEVAPYLYSDEVLIKYLNEAVAEASLRARLLVESRSAAITRITLVPGQAEYRLHDAVVVIRQAWLASDPSQRLDRTISTAIDRLRCHWRTERGQPRFLVRDNQQRMITLSPVPEVADTLQLVVWRTPTPDEALEAPDDEPVIEPMYHAHLFRWACWRAFNRKDSEQRDTANADRNLSMFEAEFGLRPTAAQLQQLQVDQLSGTDAVWF